MPVAHIYVRTRREPRQPWVHNMPYHLLDGLLYPCGTWRKVEAWVSQAVEASIVRGRWHKNDMDSYSGRRYPLVMLLDVTWEWEQEQERVGEVQRARWNSPMYEYNMTHGRILETLKGGGTFKASVPLNGNWMLVTIRLGMGTIEGTSPQDSRSLVLHMCLYHSYHTGHWVRLRTK